MTLMLSAWCIEVLFGWPDWLYRRVGHPVSWLGGLISALEVRLNPGYRRAVMSRRVQMMDGAFLTVIVVSVATTTALACSWLLSGHPVGFVLESMLAATLLASRSLFEHVQAVATPLLNADLAASRDALAQIVGRDVTSLGETEISGAALESLAESTSDGVLAPMFWGICLGLPGLAAYKAINTLDSMIGHRQPRYLYFGRFAAHLDDILNWIPARLTGWLIVTVSGRVGLVPVMRRDAPKHRSPNAGWPEAAMAGVLGVRIGGPRRYPEGVADEPWMNADGAMCRPADLKRGLHIYVRLLCAVAFCMLIVVIW